MKKLLTLTAVGAILATPAMAVQKCVAFDASTTTCAATNLTGNADWSATCTTNDTSVPIKGIAMCSNQAEDRKYVTSDAITTVSNTVDSTSNVNCWCKMVEPAVSSWVYINTYSSTSYCVFNCSALCASRAQTSSTYLSALFGSLAN